MTNPGAWLVGIPLAYTFYLYAITGNFLALGMTVFLSFVLAALVTAAIAGIQIFGSGLNATATLIVFVLFFGAGFYGISVVETTTAGNALGPANWLIDIAGSSIQLFLRIITGGGNTQTPGSSPNAVVSSWAMIQYPFKTYVEIALGIMYAIGLYFLIGIRGE